MPFVPKSPEEAKVESDNWCIWYQMHLVRLLGLEDVASG